MLYILLPIYNESENLRPLLLDLFSEFSTTETRIIAVNDGSTDQSLEILKSELRETDIICSHSINMNVGVGFSEGISEFLTQSIDGDFLIIVESDQTSDIHLIRDLYKTLRENNTDVVIASRYCDGGGYQRCPLLRRILSYGANRFMKIIFPINDISEYSLFCRGYSWGIMTQLREKFGVHGMIQSETFFANVELLIKISFLTDQITQIPTVYDYGKKKGTSKIRIILTLMEYFTMIRKLYRVRKKIRVSEPPKLS